MSPEFTHNSQCALLRISPQPLQYQYGAITLSGTAFQRTSRPGARPNRRSCNTTSPYPYGQDSVCRPPLSVALTHGIPIGFFSTRYSDVSLSWVRRPDGLNGEVPFGNPGFEGHMRLARAFRSLSRPSSPLEPSRPLDSIGTDPRFYCLAFLHGLIERDAPGSVTCTQARDTPCRNSRHPSRRKGVLAITRHVSGGERPHFVKTGEHNVDSSGHPTVGPSGG